MGAVSSMAQWAYGSLCPNAQPWSSADHPGDRCGALRRHLAVSDTNTVTVHGKVPATRMVSHRRRRRSGRYNIPNAISDGEIAAR